MRWLLILIIVAGLAIYFMGQRPSETTSAPPAQEASAPAASDAASVTPAPIPTAPAAQATPDPNIMARLQAAAQQSGVQLRNVQIQPGRAWIAVAWKGSNATLGGDFLENCRRQGLIRDFNLDTKQEGMAMEGGQPLFTARYEVYLP